MKPAPPKTEVFHYMEYFSRFFCTPKRWLKIGKKSNVIVISIQCIIPHWFSPQLFCLRNQVAQFTKPCWNTILTLNSPEESLSARCSNNSLQFSSSSRTQQFNWPTHSSWNLLLPYQTWFYLARSFSRSGRLTQRSQNASFYMIASIFKNVGLRS